MSDLYCLSDTQMAKLEPFFPKSHGKPRVDDRRCQAGQGTGGRGQLLAQVRIAANALAFYSRLGRRFDVILGFEGVHFGVCSEKPVIDIISLTFEKPACLLPGWAQMIWQSHSVEHSRLAHCCFGRICINVGNIAGVLGYGFLLFCCWYAGKRWVLWS